MARNKNKDKTKRKKKLYLLILGMIVIIIAIVLCIIISRNKKDEVVQENNSDGLTLFDTKLSEYVKETEDGVKINVSPKLNQDKKIGELQVTNIQLTAVGGITTLLADVTNNTTANTDLKNITAVFLDEKGKELFSAKGIVSALKVGASTRLNISMSSNYITAYDVEFR